MDIEKSIGKSLQEFKDSDRPSKKCSVDEAQSKKYLLETKIKDLVKEYENETGLFLNDIVVQKQTIKAYPGEITVITALFYI